MTKPVYIDGVSFEAFNSYLIFELKWADKKNTLAPRRYALNAIKTYFHGLEFNRTNFASFIASQKLAGYKNSTVNRKISYGIALAKYLNIPGFDHITYFPEHSQKKDVLTWDEMDRIAVTPLEYPRNVRNGEEINYRYYCLIRLLSETGCRISEALDLKWSEVDSNILTFYDTKNGDSRSVVITPQLAEELKQLPRYERVFNLASVSGAGRQIRLRSKIAGIVKKTSISPHLFRHSVITNLCMSGAPLKVVMDLVGHKRMETTAGYINNTLDDMENMLYQYSGLWESKLTAKTFMDKAVKLISKLLTKHSHHIKLDEDSKFYLIKIPKNVFILP